MRVVIMGLGLYKEGSGINAAKFFIRRGDSVLITDLKKENELVKQIDELRKFCKKNNRSLPEFVLGCHREEDFADVDLVLRNPGVPQNSPYLEAARRAGAKIETDISVFLKNCPAIVVGVTGTRGKSTTTTLVYEFLKASGRRVWLGGNIKISPLSFVDKIKAGDVVVLELSSWMLENFKDENLAPHVAVVTNIYPDHLNTYVGMAEYMAAKKNIFASQKKSDVLIVNGENTEIKKWRGPGKTIKFFKKDARGFKTNLLGEHNFENIAGALAVAKIFGVKKSAIKKVLSGFRGLPDRQELIREIGGVKYINDTTATTPDGCIAALRAFGEAQENTKTRKHKNKKTRKQENKKTKKHESKKTHKNIILICGGKDKNLEYGGLTREIKKYCKAVILLPGSATEKIKKSLTAYSLQLTAKNMKDAVGQAHALAEKGDIIMLSPAAASFGLFINEFDRGEKFKKEVNKISKFR